MLKITYQSSGTKAFVILGMHRSGTSLVAKAMSKEVSIGQKLLIAKSSYNPDGLYENLDFQRLNDEILKAAGGSWDNPPDEKQILAQHHRFKRQIIQLIKKEQAPLWGWKEPRTTLTIRLYLPYLNDPHFLCLFRSAEQVAESLFRRDKMPKEKGLELARIYNERLLSFLTDYYGNLRIHARSDDE